MKILLLQPPVEDFYDTDVRLQPMGLAYLKASLLNSIKDVQVKIIDLHHGYGKKSIALPSELSYLRSYYRYPDQSPFCTFYHYYRFGAGKEEITKILRQEAPDVVGISSLFTPYFREVLNLAEMVKNVTGAMVVIGGSHASVAAELLLKNQNVDYVIVGEAERSFVELIRVLQNKDLTLLNRVPGLGYRQNNQQCLNPQQENFLIDNIPFPDFSDFEINKYKYGGKPLSFILTSRGCPHNCSFCTVHATFGYRYRRRSLENIINEMKLRYQQGYRVFDFEDDNLTFQQSEMMALCQRIIQEFPCKDIQLLAMNGISYNSLDEETLLVMKAAGFTHLNLSLVSASEDIREKNQRPHTLEQYQKVVEIASQLGFQIVSYQILGLPGEDLPSMIKTLVINSKLPVLLGASMFYLIPGSPLAGKLDYEMQESDLFKARLTAMAIETDDFCRDEIYTLFVTTRIINFLKSKPKKENPRDQVGLEILQRLLTENKLYAYTSGEYNVLPQFKFEIFKRVWDEIADYF